MGFKPRPPTSTGRWAAINSSPRADRAINKLARNNGVDPALVRILAKLSWDFDPLSKRESRGWVRCDDELLEEAAADLERLGAAIGLPGDRRVEQREAIERTLAALNSIDPVECWRRFLAGAVNHDAAAVSEAATFHYLRNATATRLAASSWERDLDRIAVAKNLFLKLFRAGSVDRDRLAYAYTDLCIVGLYQRVAPSASDWLPTLARRIDALGSGSSLGDLLGCTKGLLGGDKYFRQTVLESLSFAGVLRIDALVDDDTFLPEHSNRLAKHFYSNEWRFPLRFWSEEGGRVDWERLEQLSG